MSKHDLAARLIYHHKRDPIEAYLAIVFAAFAVSHRIEDLISGSIRRFVRTARRYRTVQIQIAPHTVTAAGPARRRPPRSRPNPPRRARNWLN
jgi:hypothetical protein